MTDFAVGHAGGHDILGIGTDPFPGLGISYSEVRDALRDSPEIHDGILNLAIAVRDYWRDLAPVFGETGNDERRKQPADGEAGAYRDSIHVTWVKTGGSDMPVARVLSDDMKAEWIEYGASHMPEYAPATKTAEHFGGTGPLQHEGIKSAQSRVRAAVHELAGLRAASASREEIALAAKHVSVAREARSEAFKNARLGAQTVGRGKKGRR